MPPKEKKVENTDKAHHHQKSHQIEKGTGKFVFANGDQYEGEYEHQVNASEESASIERSGQGVLKCANGVVYSGSWRHDKLNGPGGLFEHPSGCRYEGEFRDGLFDGTGVYFWPNGSSYEGEFKAGRLEGKGTFRDPNGQVWLGTFHAHELDRGDSIARLKFRLNM